MGILVYATAVGRGSARLWRWNLASGEVQRGPLIADPVELVNIGSPSFGWLGITSDRGHGVLEASVLDSLELEAEPKRLGRGTIVTWARPGEALFVDRGPPPDGCRRTVSVSVAHVDRPGRERVLRETLCGDVLSVGRTSVGHLLTRLGSNGADVVGAGYRDAGLLLSDHAVISVSPDGDMIVTPSADLPSIDRAPAEGGSGRNLVPIRVNGTASLFGQFRGPPVPYLVGGAPLQVDEVLAYGPDAWVALAVGRVGDGRPALWELPSSHPEIRRSSLAGWAPTVAPPSPRTRTTGPRTWRRALAVRAAAPRVEADRRAGEGSDARWTARVDRPGAHRRSVMAPRARLPYSLR